MILIPGVRQMHCVKEYAMSLVVQPHLAITYEDTMTCLLLDYNEYSRVQIHSDGTCFTFQRGLRDIAELYGSEVSLRGIQEYRKCSGLQSISSLCFKAAKIAAILIDDGIEFDKMHEIEWHRSFAPVVGRILRIERLAEKILDEVR